MKFRKVNKEDYSTIVELENQGFTPDEAATPQAIEERINIIPDTFIIAEKDGQIAGYINGPVISKKYITDDLFETIKPNPDIGGYISILGLVVAKDYQRQGLAGQLLTQFENLAKQQSRHGVTLTCRQELVPLYEKYGYINEGESESQHAGLKWYNLVKEV
ncbi:GNAT family N-acetyltransferase [Staphylococcus taiwanensis]|nr:GNAT family N-acetyltransferase [Staphylococcus taiwanensis]